MDRPPPHLPLAVTHPPSSAISFVPLQSCKHSGDTSVGSDNRTVTPACRNRDSSVGIATRYGLEGPGIESRWGRNFPHLSRPAPNPPSLLYNGYRVFPGVKAAGAWC